MTDSIERRAVAFNGTSLVALGSVAEVALACHALLQVRADISLLIFDARTSLPIELDLRGSSREVLERLEQPVPPQSDPVPARGPGRPALGVVAREVTLLPRHWDWLSVQPGGASAAIRRLVEDARRTDGRRGQVRVSREVTYRLMSAVAGNLPDFELATRALFDGDGDAFRGTLSEWPEGLRNHLHRLAADSFAGE